MAARQNIPTSESEEMYLITIARAVEDGHDGPVPVPRLAGALGVSQVAANEMVRKLGARTLVEYVPYRGVTLTEVGASIASGVLRRRRLWGVFLTEHLGLSPVEADDAACEFEHVTPPDVERRLAAFLGEPAVGPQGRPIPAATAPHSEEGGRPITESVVGAVDRIDHIDAPSSVDAFLQAAGVVPGAEVVIVGRQTDGGLLLAVDGGHVELAAEIAAGVIVRAHEGA